MSFLRRITDAIAAGASTTFNQTNSGPIGLQQNAHAIDNSVHQHAETINNIQYVAPRPNQRTGMWKRLRLIDRKAESEALRDAISLRPIMAAAPFIACMVGTRDDGLRAFVGRFSDYELPAQLAMPCDYLGVFEWPETSLRPLIAELISKISIRSGQAVGRNFERGHLADLVRAYGQSICFGQVLRPATCMAHPELLADWIKFLAKDCRNPQGDALLICLLCIENNPMRPGDTEKLMSLIGEIAKQLPLKILPPCGEVEPHHLEAWVDQYNDEPEDGEPAHIPVAFAADVFGEDLCLRFEQVRHRAARELNLPLGSDR